MKGSCLIQEVGREVSKFVERLRVVQRGSGVLEESRLERAGLIDKGFPSTSGGDSCMILGVEGYPIIIYVTRVSRHHHVFY